MVSTGPIVHGVTPDGWTTCGIMYTTVPSAFFFVKAAPTDDPVDCMACLVQEARGSTDTLRIRGTVEFITSIHVITLEIELEPNE